MYAFRRNALVSTLLLAVVLPATARAGVNLGLGADYHRGELGLFSLTLGVSTPLARSIALGGRFGGFITAPGQSLGAMADLELHVDLGRVYLQGLVGPWLYLNNFVLVPHGAFGFGLHAGGFNFGFELGWAGGAMAGLRLTWRI